MRDFLLGVPVARIFPYIQPFILICVFFFSRVEYIKGDPYIRDMKNTAYVHGVNVRQYY